MGIIAPVRRALVIAVALSLPLLVVACGGEENKTTAPNTVEGQGTVQETGTPEDTTETAGGGGGGEGESQGNAENGKKIFASAGCGGCHTLKAAGATGTTGPNLDDLKPSFDDAAEQVENGGGGMPAFRDQLSEQEIRDVATFVAESAGG